MGRCAMWQRAGQKYDTRDNRYNPLVSLKTAKEKSVRF